MKEEAPKHCPPGLPPAPHTHPAPLATHTYHLSEQVEWRQGGPVAPASSRGQLPAVTHTPPGNPHPAPGPRPVRALRPGQAPPGNSVTHTWELRQCWERKEQGGGRGRPSRVMVRSIFTDRRMHAARHTTTCQPQTQRGRWEARRAQCLAALTILRGHIDVQVEAVFVGLLNVSSDDIQVGREPDRKHDFGHSCVDVLRAHWGKVCGVPDARPGWGWFRGQETFLADGGGCVGHPKVLVHRPQDLTGQWYPGTP